MRFYTEIVTPYGTYSGEILEGTVEQYQGLLEVTKHFYEQDVYYHYLEDGTFFVIGNNLIKDCLIMVKVINDEKIK